MLNKLSYLFGSAVLTVGLVLGANKGVFEQYSLRANKEAFEQFLDTHANDVILNLREDHKGMGEVNMKTLAEKLENNKVLRELFLCYGEINDDEAQSLGKALGMNTTLDRFYFHAGNVSDVGAEFIVNGFQKNKTIRELNLFAKSGKKFLGALESNKVLTNLQIEGTHKEGNYLDHLAVKSLAKILETNETLIELDLEGNKIGDEGALEIANVLKTNKTLKGLGLVYTGIGDTGVAAIAEALKQNETLKALILHGNKITDAGIQEIAKALQTNKTLDLLFVPENTSDVGKQALCEAIKVRETPLSIRYTDPLFFPDFVDSWDKL